MRIIRRLYFYTVALVSLEIVLWGLISLTRSIFTSANTIGNATGRLAEGLALILVGVPVFGFHWVMAQRFARKEMDEHASGIRAAFLYGVLLGTLIPVFQNFLSMLDRLALLIVGLPTAQAFLGPNQTWSDNLIAMVMNAIAAAYFLYVLRGDWQIITPKDSYSDLRRIYRHIWLIYTLVIVVAASQQLLRFVLSFSPGAFGSLYRTSGAHGIVLALVGTPVWVFAWKTIQDSLSEQAERESLLRLGILYLLSLAGVVTVLSAGGVVLDVALRAIFGESTTFAGFIQRISTSVSIGVPLAGVWAYYGNWLGRAMSEIPDAPRRAGMRRLYFYVLSAIGLGATFIGLSMLLSFVVDATVAHIAWADTLRPRLAAAFATLVAGIPLWLLTWLPMQVEALSSSDSGDHARRSTIRKIYLYLALFVGVVGGMIVAVRMVSTLLNVLFGQQVANLAQSLLNFTEVLFLFIGLAVYHGLTLGHDGKLASVALTDKHAAFPVLVFDPGDGFGEAILAAVQKQSPRLPILLQAVSQPVAKDAAPKAVILPADLALDPPERLRKWLGSYNGSRLVVPRAAPKWFVIGQPARLPSNQVAQAIRQLAEGQELRPQGGTSGWMVVTYVLAVLFGLEIVMALISLGVSALSG